MIGPFPKGKYTSRSAANEGRKWEHLEAGKKYRVIREFEDNSRHLHAAGETWTFLGYSYNQWDEGLSLFVSLDDEQEWHLPLQNGADEQGSVLDALRGYMEEVQ